ALLDSRPQCRFLVFDFHLVTGIDSSATHSFEQIKGAADDIGARLVLVTSRPSCNGRFIPMDWTVLASWWRRHWIVRWKPASRRSLRRTTPMQAAGNRSRPG